MFSILLQSNSVFQSHPFCHLQILSILTSLKFDVLSRVCRLDLFEEEVIHFDYPSQIRMCSQLLVACFLLKRKDLARHNLLPNNKIWDSVKLKAFADDKYNVAKLIISVYDRLGNIVGRGENAG